MYVCPLSAHRPCCVSVMCPLKLVRPGMQIPARLPRAALNPSIPPPNAAAAAAAAAAVGGPPMSQQVFIPSLTSDPSLSCPQFASVCQCFHLIMSGCLHLSGSDMSLKEHMLQSRVGKYQQLPPESYSTQLNITELSVNYI